MSGTLTRLLLLAALFAGIAGAQSPEPPQLHVDAPPELASVGARFESPDPNRLAGIMELVGLNDPGPPIRVVLVPEGSDLARRISPHVAGFALGAAGEVAIFPARSPRYPHHSLDDVLRHEVAHVLIARAARNRPVPRWFNEGLAMAAERSWGFEDQTRVLYHFLLAPATSLDGFDRLFAGGQQTQARAYALSGAFVRYLIEQHGSAAPGNVLARLGSGVPFEIAFADVTGLTLRDAESDFWRRQRMWMTWVPVVTSSAALWLLVTLIAIWAIRRRRQRDAEIRRRWEEEEHGWENRGLEKSGSDG